MQDAQQLDLHSLRHFADLVEEEGALVSLLEQPLLFPDRAGECPPFVTEELTFEQVLGHRSAVDRQEMVFGAIGSPNGGVARAISSFAGAALARR